MTFFTGWEIVCNGAWRLAAGRGAAVKTLLARTIRTSTLKKKMVKEEKSLKIKHAEFPQWFSGKESK